MCSILPPPRGGIVPVSLTWLATLICIPTPSCVRRPLPCWGANPRFKEVNQSPTSARETESALPYCPFWEGPGCSLHLRAGGRRIPGGGRTRDSSLLFLLYPIKKTEAEAPLPAEVFACLCVFGFSFSEWRLRDKAQSKCFICRPGSVALEYLPIQMTRTLGCRSSSKDACGGRGGTTNRFPQGSSGKG